MPAQIIPVTSSPNQTLSVSLSINQQSITLNLALRYNTSARYWVMSVADKLGNMMVSMIPLITGVWPAANIMAPYDYLGIGSWFVINLNGIASDWPDDTNLGTGFCLIVDDN